MALYRVEFRSHKGTLAVVNTLHVIDTTLEASVDAGYATAVADAVNTDLQAAYRGLLPTSYTLDEIVAISVPANTVSGVPAAGTHTVGVAGARAVADEDLPPRMCTMVQWTTGKYGREFRGRFFAPPMETKVGLTSDLITAGSTYGTAVTAFATDVVDQPGIASWYYVVYSRTRHLRGDADYWFIINGYKWSGKVAYLSSRDQ